MNSKLLPKLRTWQLALFLTVALAILNHYLIDPLPFASLYIVLIPVSFWILRVKENGLLRGSRMTLAKIDEILSKIIYSFPGKLKDILLRLYRHLYLVSGYGRLPYLLRTFMLLIWWGGPALVIFNILKDTTNSTQDSLEKLHAIYAIYDFSRFVNGINADAIVIGGGIAFLGLCHFLVRVGEMFFRWLETKKIEIVINFEK